MSQYSLLLPSTKRTTSTRSVYPASSSAEARPCLAAALAMVAGCYIAEEAMRMRWRPWKMVLRVEVKVVEVARLMWRQGARGCVRERQKQRGGTREEQARSCRGWPPKALEESRNECGEDVVGGGELEHAPRRRRAAGDALESVDAAFQTGGFARGVKVRVCDVFPASMRFQRLRCSLFERIYVRAAAGAARTTRVIPPTQNGPIRAIYHAERRVSFSQ